MKKFLVAIDQGTTSSRAILFDLDGNIKFTSQFEFNQYFPKNGWVEHNPNEIWLTTLKALKKVIKKVSLLKGKILSIGITNQRETTILWNKKTGKPVYNAIVWQDRRTHEYCEKLKQKKYENIFRRKTGLFIDPYFSATKIRWILENVKISKKLQKSNNLLFGTVDTFLIWKLTNGQHHLTEATNASRTMLFNINNNTWDKEILKKLNISKSILPDVKNSADNFGSTNKKIIGYEIPGLELIIAFLSFILIGLIFSTLFGKAILGYFDNLITRIPFAGNVYKAIKQITETFSNADAAYQKVVLIEYPRKDIYAIGFMTGETKGEIKDRKKIDMVNVFVPTTPNPTSGFLLFIPKEDAVELDMSVEDAIKLVVSAGMVVPPTK